MAALIFAVLTTPANPVAEVNRATDPLLRLVSTQVRAIATALRTGDAALAGNAVFALNDSGEQLRRLDETLVHVRRSAILARGAAVQDLPAATTTTATEIGHAVRAIRAMAAQTW